MFLKRGFLAILITLIGTTSLSLKAQNHYGEFLPYDGSGTWENFDLLPQYEKWGWMYEEAKNIAADLNSGGGKYYLEYKRRGGSSHQTLVRRSYDDHIMGIWSAPNHATYILGEIFAFNLARALGRSQWATPATRMTLVGPGREMAYKAYNTKNTPRARRCNRDTILNYMQKNPHYIVGAYMAFEPNKRPLKVPNIVDRKHKHRLNPSHFLVKMIHTDGKRPTGDTVYLNANPKENTLSIREQKTSIATASDIELAKQLSFMTIVDALNSQRDRFGPYGSNMEVMLNKSNQSFAITLVDNGGIGDSHKLTSLKYFTGNYGKGVSRFEREVFDKVLALYDLVHKGITSPHFDFRNVEKLKMALGYETNPFQGEKITYIPDSCRSNHSWLMDPLKVRWDKRWKAFTSALKEVAQYMRQFEGDDGAFF